MTVKKTSCNTSSAAARSGNSPRINPRSRPECCKNSRCTSKRCGSFESICPNGSSGRKVSKSLLQMSDWRAVDGRKSLSEPDGVGMSTLPRSLRRSDKRPTNRRSFNVFKPSTISAANSGLPGTPVACSDPGNQNPANSPFGLSVGHGRGFGVTSSFGYRSRRAVASIGHARNFLRR